MKRDRSEEALGLMNAAIGLVVVIPLLLVASDAMPRSAALARPGRGDVRLLPEVDQPPIITISEAEVFSFASGSAELTPVFRHYLSTTLASTLASAAAQHRCDVIEVIGHTDSQRVRTVSNLDAALLQAVDTPGPTLIPGSNPDLGLLRAWAVVGFLRMDARLAGKTFYAYSAGDAILPSGVLARPQPQPADEPSRRRIEIRLRKST